MVTCFLRYIIDPGRVAEFERCDPECAAAFEYAKETSCIVSYERTFLRPVFN